MVKLDDNIYYASIKMRGHFTELKYKFIKICLNSEFDEEETSEYDKQKSEKYTNLNTFFDFVDDKKVSTQQAVNSVENLVKFVMKNLGKMDQHCGRASIINSLIQNLAVDGVKFSYSSLLRIIYD